MRYTEVCCFHLPEDLNISAEKNHISDDLTKIKLKKSESLLKIQIFCYFFFTKVLTRN